MERRRLLARLAALPLFDLEAVLVRSTVARLHQALQAAFGWDDEHLNRFEIRGREYAVYRDGGGMIGIHARGARLDGLSCGLRPTREWTLGGCSRPAVEC
jgi:hypothetical protein